MPTRSRKLRYLVAVAIAASTALLFTMPSDLPAQQTPGVAAPAHMNPAIEKLAAGKPIFGILTSDLSRENARAMARLETDYVYIDMEHSPLNLDALANFVANMNDKTYTVQKGNAQPRSALLARFPPYASDRAAWIVKQSLDLGTMGFAFNTVETREEAEFAIKSMRYPPWKARPNVPKEPLGMRGWSPTGAVWAWGIPTEDYRRRSDVWPLNPEGDLISIMLIETQKGVDNVDAIASVPGVTALSAAAGGDLSSSLGVPSNSPEIEAARQKILAACKRHNVICSITAQGKAEIDRRLKEGWRMIRTRTGTPND